MDIIIIGCGKFGSALAKELSDIGHNITIIDRDSERLNTLGSGFNGLKIKGVEYDNEILQEAGITNANAVIAVTSYENINITVSLIAKKIYGVPRIIARIINPDRQYIYEKLAIETISPTQLGVGILKTKLAINNSSLIAAIDENYEVIEIKINKDKNLTVHEIESKYGCIISAVFKDNKFALPPRDELIKIGEKIICTVNKKSIERLTSAF